MNDVNIKTESQVRSRDSFIIANAHIVCKKKKKKRNSN